MWSLRRSPGSSALRAHLTDRLIVKIDGELHPELALGAILAAMRERLAPELDPQ
jgi:hypothetical protein